MKLVALLPFALLVACGRKEPIPQPEPATSSTTANAAPATLSSPLRPTFAEGRNGPQLRFVGRSKLRPGLVSGSGARLKAPANTTEQGEKAP